jgi:hypothetical protein
MSNSGDWKGHNDPVAAAARVCGRLHGHDRGRGGQQWRQRLQGPHTYAHRTLAAIVVVLGLLLFSIAYLARS